MLLLQVYVDKAFQRELDNLSVKCSNKPRGCKWEAILRDLMVGTPTVIRDLMQEVH